MNGRDLAMAAIDALDACGMPHMIDGSFAANLNGSERATHDADFVVDFGPTTPLELVRHLPDEIQVDPRSAVEAFAKTCRFSAIGEGRLFKIEFFELGDDPHDQERFRRRRSEVVLGRTLWYPTPEDVIIAKPR